MDLILVQSTQVNKPLQRLFRRHVRPDQPIVDQGPEQSTQQRPSDRYQEDTVGEAGVAEPGGQGEQARSQVRKRGNGLRP